MGSSPASLKFSSQEDALGFYSSLQSKGFLGIAGVDECGRGPYAGPLVAACALLPPDHGIEGISDSKKLSPKRRSQLSEQIRGVARWGIGVRSSEEIDATGNILLSARQAAAEAALQCMYAGAPIDYLLCDGGLLLSELVPFPTTAVVKGDLWFECVGAASIVAKVYHDAQMTVYHELWPEYGFNKNQGYATEKHREAIKKYGITPIHRRSFGMCKTAPERKR